MPNAFSVRTHTLCFIRVSAIKSILILDPETANVYWFIVFRCYMCMCAFDMGILWESLDIVAPVVETVFIIITVTIIIIIIYFISGL